MDAKENALRVICFNNPERIMVRVAFYELFYLGCDFEGFDERNWRDPDLTNWVDVWGTRWNKSHQGMLGYPVEKIVFEVRQRMWQLGQNGGYFCRYDQGMPYPEAHVDALFDTVDEYGSYPLQPPWEN